MIELSNGKLRVGAPMVISNARALLEAGRGLLRSAGTAGDTTILDLSAVGEVDSSALGVVFAWLRTAGERNLRLHIVNPPANMLSLAMLYGVSELLPLT
ncbi:MAG TPA: STAS domain-containing protein [Accumulibacter sp.]|jgi:phospholipid transport system transporter-binding protein|nr:STAS domain-containing protein [Accumulibacter sp.]HQC81641.1 STAS domain-containing protein [Accumulibacter sp.]